MFCACTERKRISRKCQFFVRREYTKQKSSIHEYRCEMDYLQYKTRKKYWIKEVYLFVGTTTTVETSVSISTMASSRSSMKGRQEPLNKGRKDDTSDLLLDITTTKEVPQQSTSTTGSNQSFTSLLIAVSHSILTLRSNLAATPSSSLVVRSCPDPNTIGVHCNISSVPCDILHPCQNNGTCTNVNTTSVGYNCTCPRGFSGDQCQIDHRPCKYNTCWNNGISSFPFIVN